MNVKPRVILITMLVSLLVWAACAALVIIVFRQSVPAANFTYQQVIIIASSLIIVLGAALVVSIIMSNMMIQRQKVAEDLKESEQRIRALSEAAFEGIFIHDGNIILEANDTGAKILGLEPTEIRGKSLKDFIEPQYYKLAMDNINESYTKPYEVFLRRQDGTTFSAEFNGRDTNYKGKKVKILSMRDITERKKTEEALRTSEMNFRNSMDNSPLGVCIVTADGETVYANQRFLDIYGYENLAEFRSKSVQERLTPDSYQEYLFRREKRQHSEPASDNYEVGIVRKDGSIRHLEAFRKKAFWGVEPQFQVLYNDVTERKLAEESLKESEENFRNSLDNSPLGIRISNINDQTLYTNQALLNIFGYNNIDEVRAKSPHEYYSTECYTNYLKMREMNKRGERMPDQVDIDIVRKDGTIRHLQALFKVALWDGEPQYQTLYNDITERKLAEEALRESEGRFRQLADELKHQNDQKTEFLYQVAHELKTPITAITASSELLTTDGPNAISPDQKNLLLNNINRNAWMMDTTVSELLDIAKIQMGNVEVHLEPLDLRVIIDDLTSRFSLLFKNRQQSIKIKIKSNLPLVKGDRKRTAQVILNLLSNANKFSLLGGHITIIAREQNNMVWVEVKDTAPIIDKTERDKIFEPYHRGGSAEEQQQVPGLGLGLAISKSLVTLMGGEIGVVSRKQHGNTFFFTLPIWVDKHK